MCFIKNTKKYPNRNNKRPTVRKQFNRIKIFELFGYKCQNSKCFSHKNKIKLLPSHFDIDHKDGNPQNNNISNAQVLCVLCHKIKSIKERKQKSNPSKKSCKSYRTLVFKDREKKCQNVFCPLNHILSIDNDELLHVDHIDEDHFNNDLSNLMILCILCHMQKTRTKCKIHSE